MLYPIAEIIICLLLALIIAIMLSLFSRRSRDRIWRREIAGIRERTKELESGREALLEAGASLRTRLESLEARIMHYAQRLEDSESDLGALSEFKKLFQILNQAHAQEKSRIETLNTRAQQMERKVANLDDLSRRVARLSSKVEALRLGTPQDWADRAGPMDGSGVDSEVDALERRELESSSSAFLEALSARLDALERRNGGAEAAGDDDRRWSESREAIERLEHAHQQLASGVEALRGSGDSRFDPLESSDLSDLERRVRTLEERLDKRTGGNGEHRERLDEATADITADTALSVHGSLDSRDNLKKIRGIGRVIERILNEAGVCRFEQIAKWSDQDIALYSERLGEFSTRIERDHWIEQARRLAGVKARQTG